jgi:hypothetical protein
MYALNIYRGISDLLRAPVNAHLGILRSIHAHVLNLCILFICGWIALMLLVRMARSSAYVATLSCELDVRNVYPC